VKEARGMKLSAVTGSSEDGRIQRRMEVKDGRVGRMERLSQG